MENLVGRIWILSALYSERTPFHHFVREIEGGSAQKTLCANEFIKLPIDYINETGKGIDYVNHVSPEQ